MCVRVFEGVVLQRLIHWSGIHSIFQPSDFGFQAFKDCTSASCAFYLAPSPCATFAGTFFPLFQLHPTSYGPLLVFSRFRKASPTRASQQIRLLRHSRSLRSQQKSRNNLNQSAIEFLSPNNPTWQYNLLLKMKADWLRLKLYDF